MRRIYHEGDQTEQSGAAPTSAPARSRKWSVAEGGDPIALIDALYTLSDITAEINGQTELDRVGLVDPDDIGLIDDVIDALQDGRHGAYARKVLREAVAQIARRALANSSR